MLNLLLKISTLTTTIPTLTPVPEVTPNSVESFETFSNVAAQNIAKAIKYVQTSWGTIVWNILFVIFVFITARVILAITSNITSAAIKSKEKNTNLSETKRTRTVLGLFRSFMRYAVYVAAILTVMMHFGLMNVGELITGAGVGAIVIGFGAQSIVKDVFSGIFLIFENQFAVGDHIKIEEAEGIVEATALRVTYLRTLKGERIIIPNGLITRVINFSSGGFVASVEIPVSFNSDIKLIMKIIDSAVQMYALEHEEAISEKPIVLGISEFRESHLLIKTICPVKSALFQFETERGMRLAVKEAFDVANISLPFPSHNIYERKTEVNLNKQEANSDVTKYAPKQKYTSKPIWQQHDDF